MLAPAEKLESQLEKDRFEVEEHHGQPRSREELRLYSCSGSCIHAYKQACTHTHGYTDVLTLIYTCTVYMYTHMTT